MIGGGSGGFHEFSEEFLDGLSFHDCRGSREHCVIDKLLMHNHKVFSKEAEVAKFVGSHHNFKRFSHPFSD